MGWTTGVALVVAVSAGVANAQQASVSAWGAADFRIWGYVPYWATTAQIAGFATNGLYSHVSDVIYFGGVRPDASGNLSYASSTYLANLNTMRSQSAALGFNLQLSMMAVAGSGSVDATWTSIINSPTARANFVSQLKTLMLGGAGTGDDIKGFNFDWERPSTAALWGNYTELAREVRAAFKDPSTPTTNGWEVSVCDYGSTDTNWDNTSLFDAKVYDQLMVMSYHLSASSTGTYTNQKLALTGQGAAKAFSNDQIGVGFGTWGTGGPATVSLDAIVKVKPDLAYDATTFTGTVNDINGVSRTGTWTIESRKQVREKTQVALDRGMPGMFSWTLSYDATNNLGLHRVIQHYAMVKRDVPDLDLNGKVDGADATTLANNMGTSLTNTGTATAAQFDAFYLGGNWEKGDHDGNGFVNQADADWLAGRYGALGVTLPDRLAYAGTFESFPNALGINGRWRAGRNAQGKLVETGNFKQEASGFLAWGGTGTGAGRRSTSFVTMRNQNAAEVGAGVNSVARTMRADLGSAVDLSQYRDLFFTFLVKVNTAALSAAQLASNNRTLSVQFLNGAGADQFDFAIQGAQQQISIVSQADLAGEDVSLGGVSQDTTYLVVGKVAGNGAGGSVMQASFFKSGAVVGDFMDAGFQWMLTGLGSAGYDPVISGVQFSSLSAGNFTVSNLWVSSAAAVPEPGVLGVAGVLGVLCRRPKRG